MSSAQPQQQEGSRRLLRILSLDAGGVHSLSTITILKHMMDAFNAGRKPEEKLQPWQIFDMIGGVETGGLIAIMLGRLRLSLDECEESFKELCKTIYQPKNPEDTRRDPTHQNYNPNMFDSKVLVEAVKDMIRQKLPAEGPLKDLDLKDLDLKDLDLLKDSGTSCKVFVSLSPHGSPGSSIFSSYPERKASYRPGYNHHLLWEVCAATTASAGFFDPVKITDTSESYRPDSEWDDPIRLVAQEWNELWPGRGGLMISIGSGLDPRSPIGNLGVKNIFRENPSMFEKEMWFRFNKEPILEDTLKEDHDKFDLIEYSTTRYMRQDKIQRDLNNCIGKLRHTFQSHRTEYLD